MPVDESAVPLEERVADLRLSSPAAYGAVAQHVDALETQGLSRDDALHRALLALGR
jgi:hypothetical protein